ncbi:hypothetical protein [Chitinimonas sp. BJYL2]|uniref:hypothetical protein n=1 Tax=Chitinimonas sp. BJYL2 TaxID=2976696 RepID=UPI0022B58C95|nr:hypothetical protein [Chitinimonas sp. BJYL2]
MTASNAAKDGVRHERGFGVLEVLVSLVLVTSVGIAIVVWVNNSLLSIARLESEYARIQAVRLTQDWVRSLAHTDQNKGETTIGGLTLRWERKEISRNAQAGYPSGLGQFDVILYEYTYGAFRSASDTQPWFEEQVLQVQSVKTRDFRPPFETAP